MLIQFRTEFAKRLKNKIQKAARVKFQGDNCSRIITSI